MFDRFSGVRDQVDGHRITLQCRGVLMHFIGLGWGHPFLSSVVAACHSIWLSHKTSSELAEQPSVIVIFAELLTRLLSRTFQRQPARKTCKWCLSRFVFCLDPMYRIFPKFTKVSGWTTMRGFCRQSGTRFWRVSWLNLMQPSWSLSVKWQVPALCECVAGYWPISYAGIISN